MKLIETIVYFCNNFHLGRLGNMQLACCIKIYLYIKTNMLIFFFCFFTLWHMITASDKVEREVYKKYCEIYHKAKERWDIRSFRLLIESEQKINIKIFYSFSFSEKWQKSKQFFIVNKARIIGKGKAFSRY